MEAYDSKFAADLKETATHESAEPWPSGLFLFNDARLSLNTFTTADSRAVATKRAFIDSRDFIAAQIEI